MFSIEEQNRYARHFVLPDIGEAGQQKIKAAKVLVVGAGGLGCPVLQYLVAAGVGQIGIVDFDKVSISNLQRQILFSTSDVGAYKAEVAKQKLTALNPFVQIDTFLEPFTAENAIQLVSPYDIVVDATDNFTTRYLVNDACVLMGKVSVYGAIFRFDGQVAVFNCPTAEGRSPNYRDLFPTPPPVDTVPNCAEGGVLGVLAGTIGCMQANEVIKVITGVGQPLVGRLALFDTLRFNMQVIQFVKRPDTAITELVTYDGFCATADDLIMTYKQFAELKRKGEQYQLVDVRTYEEREEGHCGGVHIPLDELEARVKELHNNEWVLLYCKTGKRSLRAAQLLTEQHGLKAKSLIND